MAAIADWMSTLGRRADRLSSGWLSDIKSKQVGFHIDEVMSGRHRFEAGFGPEGYLPFEFTVTWGPRRLDEWLDPASDRFMVQPMEGEVTMGGLCERAPCGGTLELRYFSEHRIRYAFDFTAGGTVYHFVGEKVNIRPWNLPVSHTTCFGTVIEKESGRLVSTSLTFFRLATALRFLSSFRLSHG